MSQPVKGLYKWPTPTHQVRLMEGLGLLIVWGSYGWLYRCFKLSRGCINGQLLPISAECPPPHMHIAPSRKRYESEVASQPVKALCKQPTPTQQVHLMEGLGFLIRLGRC
ncbi:hypothetical protein B0T09DRAFT_324809 [Sordaria sp. MPI-SDFR-AT-0083]|nr:hypothetical protein B0T09DRAFT_324809 [Sordaria sp. MPI-SDFR-AT-0083]